MTRVVDNNGQLSQGPCTADVGVARVVAGAGKRRGDLVRRIATRSDQVSAYRYAVIDAGPDGTRYGTKWVYVVSRCDWCSGHRVDMSQTSVGSRNGTGRFGGAPNTSNCYQIVIGGLSFFSLPTFVTFPC